MGPPKPRQAAAAVVLHRVVRGDPGRSVLRDYSTIEAERAEGALPLRLAFSLVVRQRGGDLRWWTWAGLRANATLATTLSEVVDPAFGFDDHQIRLREDLTRESWRTATADAAERLCLPEVSEKALVGLKFSAALPKRLAIATLAARMADLPGVASVLAAPSRFTATPG